MDYVWCFWIADCHKLHRFLQKFVSAEHSSERLQRRMNASILSLSPARVKPIQAITAYVSFAKITALNTLCRHSRFRPCARNVFNANTDWAQLLSTLSTCSFTVRVLVTVTTRIFMLSTRYYRSVEHNWADCLRRLSTNMIPSDFVRFSFRLLASNHCSMLWSSSCLVDMELAGTTR